MDYLELMAREVRMVKPDDQDPQVNLERGVHRVHPDQLDHRETKESVVHQVGDQCNIAGKMSN